jgi:predicted aspartyl protease
MALSILFLALALGAPTADVELPTAPASETQIIKTSVDAFSRMTVPVTIGGQGPFRFLVDTGAQNSVLSELTAAKLQLKSTERARVMSVAGSREVDIVSVDDINMGRRNWNGARLPVLAQSDLGADGIIGLDGLQNQRLLIDFRKDEITVIHTKDRSLRQSDFDIVVTARRRNGELIMTNAMIDGVNVDVVIDTGSDTCVGNRALQNAMTRHHATQSTMLHSVTGQEIHADVALAESFNVDRMRINNIQIAFADSPTFGALGLERRPALLLGMQALRLFHRIAIDFPNRRIMFAMPPQS